MDVVDLSGSLWGFMLSSGWKGHFCPTSLMAELIEDSNRRGHELGILEQASKGFIDMPGMIMTDRSHETIRIDTFDLTIPTQDYEYFYMELKKGPKRKFPSGQEYYKIHGWLVCVVFTPEQRDMILAAMKERLENGVKERAKAEDEEFTRRIQSINSDGVKIISPRDRDSLKDHVKKVLVSPPNNEKN